MFVIGAYPHDATVGRGGDWRHHLASAPRAAGRARRFGPSNATIVVRGPDGIVQVHRSTDGVRFGRCRPGAGIDMIALHPEGTSIAAAGSLRKGPLQVWPLGSEGKPFTVELEDEPAAIGLVDNFLVRLPARVPPAILGYGLEHRRRGARASSGKSMAARSAPPSRTTATGSR